MKSEAIMLTVVRSIVQCCARKPITTGNSGSGIGNTVVPGFHRGGTGFTRVPDHW